MLLWDGVPNFKAGQVLSAAGQLNSLGKGAHLLFDRATGYAAPFTGYISGEKYAPAWNLRHKWNTLDWEYWLNGSAYITANGVKLASTEKTGNGFFSGLTDLSGLGLTLGSIFGLALVVTSGSAEVYRLAERSTLSFPTLATFAAGTTPTEAHWTALATYAEQLHFETNAPRPLFGGNWGGSGRAWVGSVVKQTNTWQYTVTLITPYHERNGERTMRALLRVYHASIGTVTLASWEMNINNSGPAATHTFAGVLDVSSFNLPAGQVCRVWVDIERTMWAYEMYGGVYVESLLQIADETPSVTGWQTLPTWQHGGYVTEVDKLRNDFVTLRGAYQPLNYAQRVARPESPMGQPFMRAFRARRVHRWLHYYCENAEKQPRLFWTPSAEEKSTTLAAKAAWQVFDLGGQDGLYPGMAYALEDVQFAFEDAEP